jgi:lactoylglutathione lyase
LFGRPAQIAPHRFTCNDVGRLFQLKRTAEFVPIDTNAAAAAIPEEPTTMPANTAPAGARMLHTMLRVHDLDKSLAFYTGALGMKLLRRKDYPEGKFTLAFVGYGDEAGHTVIELTHNWGNAPYALGTGYGHIAIGVDDIYGACETLAKAGVKIARPAGPMKADPSIVIAFVEDPDGYKVELISTSSVGR